MATRIVYRLENSAHEGVFIGREVNYPAIADSLDLGVLIIAMERHVDIYEVKEFIHFIDEQVNPDDWYCVFPDFQSLKDIMWFDNDILVDELGVLLDLTEKTSPDKVKFLPLELRLYEIDEEDVFVFDNQAVIHKETLLMSPFSAITSSKGLKQLIENHK